MGGTGGISSDVPVRMAGDTIAMLLLLERWLRMRLGDLSPAFETRMLVFLATSTRLDRLLLAGVGTLVPSSAAIRPCSASASSAASCA